MATTEERDIFNNEYVQIYTNGSGNIVLLFQNEVEKTLAIGEQMNEINEEAYMNGYNWDAFFKCDWSSDVCSSDLSSTTIWKKMHQTFWKVWKATLKLVLTLLILRIPQKTSKKQNALPTLSFP